MNQPYLQQVRLLLQILPEISKIDDFVLHGGTAINLFYHNMPRLSVDIDLTYVPYSDRNTDLGKISKLLNELSNKLKRIISGIQVKTGNLSGDEVKLFCRRGNVEVKIEVNTINRGLMGTPVKKVLCKKAQDVFNTWCEINTVPTEQLFGGKIIAALDRQHPRDFFDTKKLFEGRCIPSNLLIGFLFCLLSSKRPIEEILKPNWLDNDHLIINQFSGMAQENFTTDDYQQARKYLINYILNSLTIDQKVMILRFAETRPVWIYGDWSRYPGIAWKMKNLAILKKNNPSKFRNQIKKLESIIL